MGQAPLNIETDKIPIGLSGHGRGAGRRRAHTEVAAETLALRCQETDFRVEQAS